MTNWSQTIDAILDPLLSLDPRIGAGIEGCTPDEIQHIESNLGIRLPAPVAALMQRIGRVRGRMLIGADFGYPDIIEFHQTAESLLEDLDSQLKLPQSAVVFLMEQGYQFFFVSCAGEDNPTVWFYDDDNPTFLSLGLTFTQWLEKVVGEELELWRGKISHERKMRAVNSTY